MSIEEARKMRINNDILLKIAKDTIEQRSSEDRGILAAFLCGSTLGADALLGGSADIDLGIVHIERGLGEREIIPLTNQVHIDICYFTQKEFRNTRRLRVDPWLGPMIFGCKVLYDPQHLMNFTQASVRGQFHHVEYTLLRTRSLAEGARQRWFSLNAGLQKDPPAKQVLAYLKAVEQAVNAIASLSGSPLATRRLMREFPTRAEAVGKPGLYPGLLGLLGVRNCSVDDLKTWMINWEQAWDALPESVRPPELAPGRKDYYRGGMQAMLAGPDAMQSIWVLLTTWTISISLLSENTPVYQTWDAACRQLGLLDEAFSLRVEALDAYLDMVEETLDDWARQNGG